MYYGPPPNQRFPANVQQPLDRAVPPPDLPAGERDEAIRATLVQREGRPENVALAVLHFIDNDFVTGACLPVDGGRTIFAP